MLNEIYSIITLWASGGVTMYTMRNRQAQTARPFGSMHRDQFFNVISCRKLPYDNRTWVAATHISSEITAQRIAPTIGPFPYCITV